MYCPLNADCWREIIKSAYWHKYIKNNNVINNVSDPYNTWISWMSMTRLERRSIIVYDPYLTQ